MECDLLVKEDEFYKENERVALKTKEILQKVNDLLNIQDHLMNATLKPQFDVVNVQKNSLKFSRTTEKDENEKVDGAAALLDGGGNEEIKACSANQIRFAVVAKERLEIELRNKLDEVKTLQRVNQTLKDDKEKWYSSYNSCKTNIVKVEHQIANLKAKLRSKDLENLELKKEVDRLKRELKNATVNSNNCELRLCRTAEENEKLKATLRRYKDEEKDLKESWNKQQNELTLVLKQLEKQKEQLLGGFKKQMHLIKLLQDQKTLLEMFKMGEMSEADYLKILEWK